MNFVIHRISLLLFLFAPNLSLYTQVTGITNHHIPSAQDSEIIQSLKKGSVEEANYYPDLKTDNPSTLKHLQYQSDGSWKLTSQDFYQYDHLGRETHFYWENATPDSMEKSGKYTTIYREPGVTSVKYFEWEKGHWKKRLRYDLRKDDDGNFLSNTLWIIQAPQTEKKSFTYYEHSFNSSGHLTMTSVYGIDANGNSNLNYRDVFTLDSLGQPTKIDNIRWSQGSLKTMYSEYDIEWEDYGKNLRKHYKTVNYYSNPNTAREYNYIYSSNGDYEYTTRIDNNGQWTNDSRRVFQYDSPGNLIKALTFEWDGSSWVPDYGTEFVYQIDASGRITERVSIDYNNLSQTWDTTRKVMLSYEDIAFSVTDKEYNPYPNPTGDKIWFNLQQFGETAVSISLYDLNGKLVNNISSTYSHFNDDALSMTLPAKGIYIYRVEAGETIRQGKVIRQ